MKIAYCIHSLHRSGGMERVLSLKANYLADRMGYEVVIIASALKGRKPFFPLSDKVEVIDLGINDNAPLGGRRFGKALERALGRIDADIAISLCGSDVYQLFRCKDGSRKMAEFHFVADKYYHKYASLPFGRLYARYRTEKLVAALRNYDAFVALTKQDRDTWAARLDHVYQIYNPIDIAGKASALDSGKMIVAGRLDKYKNVRDAVSAWKTVAASHPDWKLEIYGDGSLRKELEAQIRDCGLDSKVFLMGNSPRVREIMSESSAIIMTSLFEGLPLVLLEASAAGLPLLSYDCPFGPSEIVEDGKNGFLVPVGDVEMLACRINTLIEDEELRKKMGRASLDGAARFSYESVMAQWDRLFRTIASSGCESTDN